MQACQTEQGLSDVAAAAEQLQPKGITLSTTKVTDAEPEICVLNMSWQKCQSRIKSADIKFLVWHWQEDMLPYIIFNNKS